MVVLVLVLAVLIKNISAYDYYGNDPDSRECELGDVVQNGRMTCTCGFSYNYDCIYKKQPLIPYHKLSLKKKTCQPNKIYVENTTTCICNRDGSWPHLTCYEVFDSLPASAVIRPKCKPYAYVFVGCNVCRCNAKGQIDKTRCTRNVCHQKNRRRSNKGSNVYGNCEAKNWYSLAPCQFCFCLNENKLVCNTGNHLTEKLQLGSYNLNVCGKDLIREAIELIPNEDKLLRHGEGTTTTTKTSSTTRSTTVTPSTLSKASNLEFEIDVADGDNVQENNSNDDRKEDITSFSESTEDQKAGDVRDDERDEDKDDESDEDKDDERDEDKDDEGYKERYDEIKKVASTQLPQDDYQLYSKETKETLLRKDDEEDGTTDTQIKDSGLNIPHKPLKTTGLTNYVAPGKKITLKNLEDLGEELKNNLPMMLDKVFQMALRKSMVTLDHDSTCVPGAVNTINCNTCFCLKNSKLLCTNNKCEGKQKV